MWTEIVHEGETGSEGGIILKDEEYKESCRITLEKCARYFAITCGVYGAMVHTVFCSESDAHDRYLAMKEDLQSFIDADTSCDEEEGFYERFMAKY